MMNYKNGRNLCYENQKNCIRTGNPAQNQAQLPDDCYGCRCDFVFSAIKAIGAILLGFGIVQIGLALKSHDAGQRAQGFMTFFGGVIIYFAKDILDMIL